MSRLATWAVCCVVTTAALLVGFGRPVDTGTICAMYWLMGVPLALHYVTGRNKP